MPEVRDEQELLPSYLWMAKGLSTFSKRETLNTSGASLKAAEEQICEQDKGPKLEAKELSTDSPGIL